MSALPVHTLERAQWLDRPPEEVFHFFERPENLAQVTPSSLDFRLLTPSPVPMGQGRIIDYTIRVAGMRVRWRTLVSTYDPPFCFVDEQLSGPYSFWHHTHRFEPRAGGTLMTDRVRYALPAYLPAPAEALVHRWQVGPRLRAIFDYRRERIQEIVCGNPHRPHAAAADGCVPPDHPPQAHGIAAPER